MSKLNRRVFVKTCAAASAAFSTFVIAGTKASGRVLGTNDVLTRAVYPLDRPLRLPPRSALVLELF